MKNKTVVRVVVIVVIVVVLGVVAVVASQARTIKAPAPINPAAISIGRCIESSISDIKNIGAIGSRINDINISGAIGFRAINQGIQNIGNEIEIGIPGC